MQFLNCTYRYITVFAIFQGILLHVMKTGPFIFIFCLDLSKLSFPTCVTVIPADWELVVTVVEWCDDVIWYSH